VVQELGHTKMWSLLWWQFLKYIVPPSRRQAEFMLLEDIVA
jgi:hypothetical protein